MTYYISSFIQIDLLSHTDLVLSQCLPVVGRQIASTAYLYLDVKTILL